MTYTHPYHVGSIYPREMKLPLLRSTECGSRVTLNPQPPAVDTKLLCIQLQVACCARQRGLFPLLTFDNMIGLHIDGWIDIEWKCVCSGFIWVRMGSSVTVFWMRLWNFSFYKRLYTSRVDPVDSWWLSGLGVLYITDQFLLLQATKHIAILYT
jgi:hypothetical protein